MSTAATNNVAESPDSLQAPRYEDDEREATELNHVANDLSVQHDATSEGSAPSATSRNRLTAVYNASHPKQHRFVGLRKFWGRYIQLQVPHNDCRDHLANERTFLAYLRTSLALSMLGIVTAQLFSLQHPVDKNPIFGYHALGKPLAALFQLAAIFVVLVGGHRFWRQQMNMARGKIWAGGWEIWVIMGLMFMLVVSVFGLLVAADITK